MSNTIQIKRGTKAPGAGVLQPGELGINMSSGILYIGSNQTNDNNKYIPMYPFAYRILSSAEIQSSQTQEDSFWSDSKHTEAEYSGPYLSLAFANNAGEIRGSIMITSKNRINLNCQVTGSDFADRYLLPEPTKDLTDDVWYSILTSKNTITVAQGGTGQTSLTSGHVLIGNGTGAIASRAIKNNTAIGDCDWNNVAGTANGTNLITLNTLAFWNGRYNDTASNLAYCSKGAFGNAAIKNVTSSVTSGSADLVTSGGVYSKCANYLPLSGGMLTDTLILPANKHYTNTVLSYALNCRNSDIINANGIWFLDKADSNTEGLHFLNTSGTDTKHWTANDDRTWDTLYAVGGQLKFHPNRGSFDSLGGYQVFHSGNYTSLFHLPRINIFNERTLDKNSGDIEISFGATSNVSTGSSLSTTRSFSSGHFYLFYTAFTKAAHDGTDGSYYSFLLVPQSLIPEASESSGARGFVISSGKDAKYFSVRYNNNKMIISYKGYDGENGSKDNTFGMYCIY